MASPVVPCSNALRGMLSCLRSRAASSKSVTSPTAFLSRSMSTRPSAASASAPVSTLGGGRGFFTSTTTPASSSSFAIGQFTPSWIPPTRYRAMTTSGSSLTFPIASPIESTSSSSTNSDSNSHSDTSPYSEFDTSSLPTLTTPAVATWLYICSGMVFFIVVVGGVTRLTESGLSITEWEPVKGILPPIGEEQWLVEWEKYRVTPEGVLMNSQLDLESFKRIFYMEWAHRLAGRALGVAFILPAGYFLLKRRVSPTVRWKLLAIASGIGFQGFLGWYMVKSGLSSEILSTPGAVPRVSQYRLAAHLGAALVLYLGMLHTAVGVGRDWKFAMGDRHYGKVGGVGVGGLRAVLAHPKVRRFGKFVNITGALVLLTAVSGAFVAGLDAGLVYNEFPTMGGRIVPPTDELFDKHYAKALDGSDTWWRNILENPTTVQFDHRVLATTTLLSVLSLPYIATRPAMRKLLPPLTPKFAKGAMHAVLLQVTLGITTLLYLVPVPLAAAHQAGSVLLLTMMVGLSASLRKPGKVARLWRDARDAAARAGRPSTPTTILKK